MNQISKVRVVYIHLLYIPADELNICINFINSSGNFSVGSLNDDDLNIPELFQ